MGTTVGLLHLIRNARQSLWLAVFKPQTVQQFHATQMGINQTELRIDMRPDRASGAAKLRLKPRHQGAFLICCHSPIDRPANHQLPAPPSHRAHRSCTNGGSCRRRDTDTPQSQHRICPCSKAGSNSHAAQPRDPRVDIAHSVQAQDGLSEKENSGKENSRKS